MVSGMSVKVTISKPKAHQRHSWPWLSKFMELNCKTHWIGRSWCYEWAGIKWDTSAANRPDFLALPPPNHNTDLPHRLWPRLNKTAVTWRGKWLMTSSWLTFHHAPIALGGGAGAPLQGLSTQNHSLRFPDFWGNFPISVHNFVVLFSMGVGELLHFRRERWTLLSRRSAQLSRRKYDNHWDAVKCLTKIMTATASNEC